MIRVLPLLFIILLPGAASGQFSLNAYLGTARYDISLQGTRDQLDYLGNNRIRTPIINRLEFRAQTQDLNIVPESYRLRITPTNPFENIRNRQMQEIEDSVFSGDLQFKMNNALIIRYRLIIHYIFYRERLDLIDQQIGLLNDELKFIKNEGEFDELDPLKLVDTEKELTEKRIEKSEMDSRIKKSEITIRGLYDFSGEININRSQLISVSNMNSLVLGIHIARDSLNIYLSREKLKQDLRQAKFRTDLARSFRNIGFLEAQYRPYRGDYFSNRLGFEIGIRIPVFNEDKADHQRSYLNLLGDQHDYSQKKDQLSRDQEISFIDIMSSISKYEIINSMLELLFPGDNIDIYKKQVNKNPEKLFKIKSDQLKMMEDRIDYIEKVYEDYIDFLDEYGKLSGMPLHNYLSPSLDEI